ncbi:MAG: PD40 domain-containing protein [Flavobacteriales bacterium]|nr:PD40 domain-containing protein [Flavobacteriales bacterium]
MLIITVVGSVFSQEKLSGKDEKQILEKAEFYYEDEDGKNIPKALELFEQLQKNKPEDPYYKLMVGICYTYFKNRKEDALLKLKEVKTINPEFNEVNFYLGRAYAVNSMFDEAVAAYEEYMSKDDVPEEQKGMARQNIIYCQNAKEYMKDTVEVQIKNIGSPINTDYSEYVPVITPDESMLVYTYRGNRSKGGLMDQSGKKDLNGHYYEDVMVSYKLGDSWLEPESIGENINTEGHDASIALSVDGQTLFIYEQDKKNHGDIYMSKLNGEVWSKPEKLLGDVNKDDSWEGSATLTSDGKTLYFASNREGGFGGRDLYSAKLQADGTWGDVQNLGPVINTRLDDDAPFIHPDMRTMYYSSKGKNSMGDYDIFYTYLDKDGWDEPENIGYPVNTIDDDRYYVLSADAKTGYYSTAGRSNRGTHDIFTVSPGHFGKRPILALIVGVTKADGEAVEADITVSNEKSGEEVAKYKSNANTGNYMLALTPGNKYKIAIEVEGYETKIDYIDIESLQTYVQVEHDFNVYSKENVEGVAVADELDPLQGKIDKQIEQYRKENTKEGYEEMIHQKILNEKGEEKMAGVEYFIDAGCLEEETVNPEIAQKIKTVSYPDGTSKKIVGPFETLLASEIAKQRMIEQDSACKKVEVKVNDNGTEKSFKEFYAQEYTKTQFSDVTIHDKLTSQDTTTKVTPEVHDKDKAINLQEVKGVDLSQNNLADAAEKTITGLSFKVEIGAVTDTNDFKMQHLSKYGKITKKTYPDGLTRYTFGPFETLVEAEKFREMLIEKEKDSKDAFVTVFVFGQRKTMEEYSKGPCETDTVIDFSWFIGKDLNDKSVYDKLIKMGGNSCAEGLEFKVQIAAYRFPKNYKWNHLKQYGQPLVIDYPDGITRFTQGTYRTLAEAEVLRQKIIKAGQTDAWITPFYNGKRMLLEELFKVNFYGKSVN